MPPWPKGAGLPGAGSGEKSLERNTPSLSSSFVRDLYTRMLLTRIVDTCVCCLQQRGQNDIVPTCQGREAAQVGSAICAICI